MSDTIEFPLNDYTYYNKAREHINNEEFKKAYETIIKVKDKNPAASYLEAFALYHLDEIEEALEVTLEHKEYYVDSEKHALFYVLLLLENDIFLEAEAHISNYLTNTQGSFHEEWKMLNIELYNQRERYNERIKKIKSETKMALLDIGSYSIFEQTEIIKSASMLDLIDLQTIAQSILNHYNLSPHNQRAFLEVLIGKNDSSKYLFTWFSQQKEIIPNQLKRFEETKELNEIDAVLTNKLTKHPHLFDLIFTEIVNDLLLLYPFSDEIVLDVEYWVMKYIQLFSEEFDDTFECGVSSVARNVMDEWFARLSQLANRN